MHEDCYHKLPLHTRINDKRELVEECLDVLQADIHEINMGICCLRIELMKLDKLIGELPVSTG